MIYKVKCREFNRDHPSYVIVVHVNFMRAVSVEWAADRLNDFCQVLRDFS